MLITKEIELDMAHRVMNHKSKCQNLHGHRYKIEVGVDDKVVSEQGVSNEGMVIDFGDLKNIMMDVLDKQFDHNSIFSRLDPVRAHLTAMTQHQTKTPHFVDFIPTAENLAKYWYQLMKVELEKVNIKIKHVRVWETPTSTALYEESQN